MGSTWDSIGLDVVVNDCLLPKLDVGAWIMFPDIGAYSVVCASYFSGMTKPKCYYVLPEQRWSVDVSVSQNQEETDHLRLNTLAH